MVNYNFYEYLLITVNDKYKLKNNLSKYNFVLFIKT